ncbi:hypothetical protein MKJ04_05610 [Pontibacter sp. E15-1]|uniref:hypothetical protein n=1 Tax=Pontibacter sp. E15-1 TaxID=2919918 RepID=UPI001F4F194B|nr:hypothetical protein [Pontibacter sp. E15-1]MCJ8164312.1 hypothetical protein [Pontibacter sp. E15-1]
MTKLSNDKEIQNALFSGFMMLLGIIGNMALYTSCALLIEPQEEVSITAREHEGLQKAAVFILSGYATESPSWYVSTKAKYNSI